LQEKKVIVVEIVPATNYKQTTCSLPKMSFEAFKLPEIK